ncbi:MAG: efflux RND transporter permease subunit [Halocynthiibacter sp.]
MGIKAPRVKGMGILSYFTRHATAANLILVIMIALGAAALPRMRTQFFPDVILDSVSVNIAWSGAGAEDVDRAIVQLVEPTLIAVEGVEDATSTAHEGFARVSLDFEAGWDMARAANDVQAAIDTITDLPEDAERPEVRRGVWSDRVTDVVITGPVGAEQLARFADEFVLRLFAQGITRTTLRGVNASETVVDVRMVDLIKHDVTMAAISSAIAAEVNTLPSGEVKGANIRIRTGKEKRSSEDIKDIVLRVNADGSQLKIKDVAGVKRFGSTHDRQYFVGDNPAISIRVDRSATGDAIQIQKDVEKIARDLERELPEGSSIDLIRTRSEAISARLSMLLGNAAQGLMLVMLLLFLFLNARTAFWVSAGIPVALMAAVALMYMSGLTINMISLFALIITLGIVVDDAIVVGEHADYRARVLGEDAATAAENAAIRMAGPVFSATVTTVIAFFGLMAIGGRFGDLISAIPFTVIAVLAASLVECFLLLPHHMKSALSHVGEGHWYDWPSRQVNKGFTWVRDGVFRHVVDVLIKGRYVVVAAVIFVLSTQAALVISGSVNWRFFNAPEASSISGNFAMLDRATRADSVDMMRELQRATRVLAQEYEEEYGANPLDYVLVEVGGNAGRPLSGMDNKDKELLGSISIELIDPDLRPYSSFDFLRDLQKNVQKTPLVAVLSFRSWRQGPGGDALSVELYGAESTILKAAAEGLKARLTQFPEVSALEDSLAYDKDEYILELTPTGEALGFRIEQVGRDLRARLDGIEAATYPEGARMASIRVELPATAQNSDFLDQFLMRSDRGEYVPLADIVNVKVQSGFSVIQRENGVQVVTVSGDISEDDPARAAAISELIQTEILPNLERDFPVQTQMSGLAEQEDEFLNDAKVGFGLCLLGIYLVLAWIFKSWARPLVVMIVIPFGVIGAIFGHWLLSVPLSMFSVVGLIGMTGIIINDSIVLVTTVDEFREKLTLKQAIIEGVTNRLRPVLLTTLTTVFGLMPLLFEKSVQAQFLKPTVITLTFGLGFGMVLVLMVVPAFLMIGRDIRHYCTASFNLLRAATHTERSRAVWLHSVAAAIGVVFLGLAVFPRLLPVSGMAGLAIFALGTGLSYLLIYVVGRKKPL